jgi:heat shock protein HslJ/membrane-bound inhibitor of C-type lysozyme
MLHHPFRPLLLAAALLAPGLAAEAREITGQMAYAERIALPEGADLRVELRGPEGIAAEVTVDPAGRQVPLPFMIEAPNAGAFSLQGAIFAGGLPQWVSAPVAVPEGEAALDLGLVPLTRHVAMGFATRMRCGTTVIEAGFRDASAVVRVRGETLELPQTVSGSGARFSDGATPETVFWSKGRNALLTLRGVDLPECVPMIDPPILPMTASGNEPFWRLDLDPAGYRLERDLGASVVAGALPAGETTETGLRFATAEGPVIDIARAVCRDTMTGMPRPFAVTVAGGGAVLSGCGGAPADLLAGPWVATEIAGAPLAEGVEVTLAFDTAGARISGTSACNRYFAGFALTGEGLSFDPAAGTMMACPDDLMAVERAFLDLLPTVSRFDVTEAGDLVLYAGDAAVLSARR